MGNAEQLQEWLDQYKRNIFLGGAGVSSQRNPGFPQRPRALYGQKAGDFL